MPYKQSKGCVIYAGGFPDLPQQLQLHTSHQKLPTSHTCAFQLNLPHFLSLEDMTAAFETALTESEGFGFA